MSKPKYHRRVDGEGVFARVTPARVSNVPSDLRTPENAALADLLLGQVHALLGHGADALAHARAAHAFLAPAERPGWQVAFAHAVLAHAAHVAGDAQLHARAHAHAVAAAALLDAQDRRIFDASFGTVPTPPR